MKESNEELIRKAKNGDSEALNKLFINMEGLRHYVALKYKDNGIEYEELLSLCSLGMLQAYYKFDESKGFVFVTLCTMIMEHKIMKQLRYLRANKRVGLVISIDDDVNSDSDNPTPLKDMIADDKPLPEDICVESEDKYRLKEALKKLTEEERSIIELHYYKGLSQVQIAEELGTYQVRVSRKMIKAINKLKTLYTCQGGFLYGETKNESLAM